MKKKRFSLLNILFILVIGGLLQTTLPLIMYEGGGTVDVSKRLNLKEIDGKYMMAYVRVRPLNLWNYLRYKNDKTKEIESITVGKANKSENYNDTLLRDSLDFKISFNSALKAAYDLAGLSLNLKETNYAIYFVDDFLVEKLHPGDELLKINDKKINSLEEFRGIVKKEKPENELKLLIKRKDKEEIVKVPVREKNGDKFLGISVVEINKYKEEKRFKTNFNKEEVGPSGGLLMALSIYDEITEKNLSRGRSIVGTGAINSNGEIQEIGGVNFKTIAAAESKADLLVLPYENYEEALKTKKDNNLKIRIIKAKTLEEAVFKIENA